MEVGWPTRLHRGAHAGRRSSSKGEKTLAEVARELDIQPSVVRQWKRRFEAGATAAVATNEDVVPVSALRKVHQRIRKLEWLLGKKRMEIEIDETILQQIRAVTSSRATYGHRRVWAMVKRTFRARYAHNLKSTTCDLANLLEQRHEP